MKLMIPPTFGSPETPLILKTSDYFKPILKIMGLWSISQATQSRASSVSGDYMDILIKQNRPADQKYNKFYYVIDEKWLKLTTHEMRSALVDMKLDKQSTYTTHTSTSPMPHFSSHSSPAPMRSPMNLELASFKKSIKREASAYSEIPEGSLHHS